MRQVGSVFLHGFSLEIDTISVVNEVIEDGVGQRRIAALCYGCTWHQIELSTFLALGLMLCSRLER